MCFLDSATFGEVDFFFSFKPPVFILSVLNGLKVYAREGAFFQKKKKKKIDLFISEGDREWGWGVERAEGERES